MANASAVQAQRVRAAIYLRISRDDEKRGLGVERQEIKCRAEAERQGWDVAIVFSENDTKASGRKPRPKYEAMLAMVRRGELDAIVGYAQDRVTRKQREAEDIIDLHDSLGLRVATSSGGEVRLDDPDGRANFRASTTNGMREIDWTKKRVGDETTGRAMKGQAHGPAPFGWRRVIVKANRAGKVLETKDELDLDEAGALQMVARRLLAGASLRSLTAELEAGPVRPRRAQHWTSTTLRCYLLREANAGRRVYRGQVLTDVQAQWPAIFDAVTFGRLKALLTDPERKGRDMGKAPRWLLSCIASCGTEGCNGTITVWGGGNVSRRPVYRCNKCLQRHWVEDLDAYIGALVEARLADPKLEDLDADTEAELSALYAQRDQQELEKTQAAEMVGKGITLAQLVTLNAGYDARLAELDGQIQALLPSSAAQVDLPDGWAGAGLEEKRAALRQLFSAIELQPQPVVRMQRPAFTPEHVRVVWA